MTGDLRRARAAPTVLAGLVAAGATALAAGRELVSSGAGEEARRSLEVTAAGAGSLPAAQALALVTLACWGVLLVSRGWPRRVVAVVAVLAAAATLAVVVSGAWTLPGRVRDALTELGAPAGTGLTGWYWVALVAAAASLATTLVAAVAVRRWPEMGRRYDAPGTAAASPARPGEASSTDLWRALDEGVDPTA